MPSSLVPTVARQCGGALDDLLADADRSADLAAVFDALSDPRRVRGRRYSLGALLVLCTAAVLAGATTVAAIARFAAGLDPALRTRAGLIRGIPRACCTLRRLLARLDGDALDAAVGTRLQHQAADALTTATTTCPGPVKRRAVAVDGKTLRGSRTRDRRAVHLLAAALHGTRTVIAQRQVDSKSNEITAFQPLLNPLDLTDTVVTFDAMLTRHDHARSLVEDKHAHDIALVKANHPNLHNQLRRLPWRG